MKRTATQLRNDAIRIWRAGLEAVRSDRLVRDTVRVNGTTLAIGEEEIDLGTIRRIIVVGAGKAGAGMAAGLEEALGQQLLETKQVAGWVNVPDDCVQVLQRIQLHGARPAGLNEPTTRGQTGAAEIRRLVENAAADDLVIVLISGGASALLPEPVEGVSLAEKLQITQFLSAAGASIAELNTVRKHLSRIKGGGLARACRAGRMYALVISDVLGDPLDVIASGPTVVDTSTIADALAVLDRYGMSNSAAFVTVTNYLRKAVNSPVPNQFNCEVHNLIIGNNAMAVDAAGAEAERLGYSHAMIAAKNLEGPAEDIGRHLASLAIQMRDNAGPDCLISGGEPVVRLAPAERRGRGGRNQQLVLAAMESFAEIGGQGIAILSAGTDGEDGPTDAAGAVCDEAILAEVTRRGLDLKDYLVRNDAYSLFEQIGGLIKTGPTHTNVCDVRVTLVDRTELARR